LAEARITAGGEYRLPLDDIGFVVELDEALQQTVPRSARGDPKGSRQIDENHAAVGSKKNVSVRASVEVEEADVGHPFHRRAELAEVIVPPFVDVFGEPQ
jgi:hypothetical protein